MQGDTHPLGANTYHEQGAQGSRFPLLLGRLSMDTRVGKALDSDTT
jgi:hypothetical protein